MKEKSARSDSVTQNQFVEGGVSTDVAIQNLTQLNGVSISELEERMRPAGAGGNFPGMRSYDGFLGDDESLLEALVKQNQMVREAGFTHQELASWLKLAMDREEEGVKRFEYNGMTFTVDLLTTLCAGQTSPFANGEKSDTELVGWDGEYVLKNHSTGRLLEFTPQIAEWIRKYGFYEGFETPYHVSPKDIIDIFTRKDRIFHTLGEITQMQADKRMNEGWHFTACGTVDEAKTHSQIGEYVTRALDDIKPYAYRPSQNDLVEVISDNSLIACRFFQHSPFTKSEIGLAVYDASSRRLLYRSDDSEIFEMERIKNEDGSTRLVTTHLDHKGLPSKHKRWISAKPDQNGCQIFERGEIFQLVRLDYLFEYGRTTVDSQDILTRYENPNVAFYVQGFHKLGQAVGCVYIHDKSNGHRSRLALTGESLTKLLGNEVQGVTGVSQVTDVHLLKGAVEFTVHVGNKPFDLEMNLHDQSFRKSGR
jgi:hypothetical protein